jgi:hypothetical protein
MLTYFRVQNYKCLENVELPLTPIHVIIGPNDSGKTSLLEAMLIYMRSTGLPINLRDAFPYGWQGTELVFNGAKESPVRLMALGEESRAARTKDIPPALIMGYGFEFFFVGKDNCTVVKQWQELRQRLPDQKLPSGEVTRSFQNQRV